MPGKGNNDAAMIVFRSLVFNTLFLAYHLALVLALTALLPFPRPWSQGVARLWTEGVGVGLRLVIGLDVEIRGREHLPIGPCVIVCKHQSAWDTFVFYSLVSDPNYILKKELTDIPLWGWCALKCGAISVDRSGGAQALKKMVRDTEDRVAKGRQVVIFPEGTRIPPGEQREYHPGVAAVYARTKAPVVPVALNSGLFWGRRSFQKKPGVITLEFLPPMPPGLKRRQFMEDLRGRIEGATENLVAEARQRFQNL